MQSSANISGHLTLHFPAQHVAIVLNLIKDGYFLLHPEQLPVRLQ